MYLESTQILTLTLTLVALILIFVLAYSVPVRVSVAILLVMVPFQPIEAGRFESANILMAYVLFGALLLRGRLRYLPMLGAVLLVVFAYLLTISQLHPALYIDHLLEFYFLLSGILVFILAYNLAREIEGPRFVINIFIAQNVLVVGYCLVQFSVGPGEQLAVFGSEWLSMHRNRGGAEPRLIGPFGSAELTAAYFMTMTVILAYEIASSLGWRRMSLLGLAGANVAMLLATGSRGSLLVLLVSFLGFLLVFHKRLGFVRIAKVLLASSVVFSGAALLIVNYSEFGVIFDRLDNTHIEGGVPDTRQRVWGDAWTVIGDKPWLGHGPKLVQSAEDRRRRFHSEQLALAYPHSLYLHLLVTVGIVGTICMLLFLFGTIWRVYKGAFHGHFNSSYERGWILVGGMVMLGIMLDQIRIEFLRHSSIDYAHFLFAVFGVFLAWADRAKGQVQVHSIDVVDGPLKQKPNS